MNGYGIREDELSDFLSLAFMASEHYDAVEPDLQEFLGRGILLEATKEFFDVLQHPAQVAPQIKFQTTEDDPFAFLNRVAEHGRNA